MRKNRVILFAALIALSACSGGGGGGGGSGASCLGSADPTCGETEYCQVASAGCGLDGVAGDCKNVPDTCSEELSPVCTCDGLSFDNACLASQAGQSVASSGECA